MSEIPSVSDKHLLTNKVLLEHQHKVEEDSWEVVQEQYIHAKLSGLYQDDLFRATEPSEQQQSDFCNLTIQIVGLDSDEPILQIGKEIFAGSYQDCGETSVFFRCEPRPLDQIREDPVFSRDLPAIKSNYECKTSKVLCFKRVFLTPKEPHIEKNDDSRSSNVTKPTSSQE